MSISAMKLNMKLLFGVVGIFVIWNHDADAQSRCSSPPTIQQGYSLVIRGGMLAQYFCNKNYHVYGTRMLSCVQGSWRGTPPQCVAATCDRLVPPLHADRRELLRGSVIIYTCRDGFTLDGVAEIYCDGMRWSSPAPKCLENREENLLPPVVSKEIPQSTTPEIIPNSPEQNSNSQNSSTLSPIPSQNSPISGQLPSGRYVSHSENTPQSQFSRYGALGKNGVLSLYKTPGAADAVSAEDELPPRERIMPPAEANGPDPSDSIPLSPALPQQQRYPQYPQPDIRVIPTERVFNWQYPRGRQYYQPRQPYVPQFIPAYQIGGAVPPMYPQSSYYGRSNPGIISSNSRIINPRPNFANHVPSVYPEYGKDETAFEPVEPTESIPIRTNTAPQPTPPSRIKVPPLSTESSEVASYSGISKACSKPRKPMQGYFVTHALPRDYEGEAMYFVKYHCLRGLSLVGGDSQSYCMRNGQWKGTVPQCKKIVKCEKGYMKQQDVCVDVNECEKNNGGCAHTCINFEGGHRCSCRSGFLMYRKNDCVDIDECQTIECEHGCRNLPGSYECSCQSGYVVSDRDPSKCIDADECASSSSRPCDHLCQNTIGSYRCACQPNFRLGEDGRACLEVCMPGYAPRNGTGCFDEDECAEHGGLGNCAHVCNNTAGSYFCSCHEGYTLKADGQSCSDVDECEYVSQCSYGCLNTVGSYNCVCPPDQISSEDGLSCLGCRMNYYLEDVECTACPGNSRTESIGAISIDQCTCIPGYGGNPRLGIPCTDVDECEDSNYGCSHRCVNTPGSVLCVCPIGYILDFDGRTCIDEDECLAQPDICGTGNECRNSDGSYSCVCMKGLENSQVNPTKCVDVDECRVRNGGCQSRCHNMQPGFRCSCYGNKVLAKDGKSCIQTGQTCSSLELIPHGGVIPRSSCSLVQSVSIGKVCFYTCRSGYKRLGQWRVTCGETGWSGKPPQCLPQNVCPPMDVPSEVRISPSSCGTTTSLQWRLCRFSCKNPSDRLKGSRSTRCMPGNRWENHAPTCIAQVSIASEEPDLPWIKCPLDMNVRLARGQSGALVRVFRPVTNMNTTTHARSDGIESMNFFPAGITTLTFTAFSADRLQNASCDMHIRVRDREAPTIRKCPGKIDIESTHRYPERLWRSPVFSDNVGVVSVNESRFPSGNITWGRYSVSYVASDAAGNMAECAFLVIIKRPASRSQVMRRCGTPTGPLNGNSNCQTWARGVYCDPACNPGYAFEQVPSPYVCGSDGSWTPDNRIPDCMDMRLKEAKIRNNRLQTGNELSVVVSTTVTPSAVSIFLHSSTPSTTERRIPHTTLPPRESTPREHAKPPQCPFGKVPAVSTGGLDACVNCSKGYYKPRIKTAMVCMPCSPGFYQDKDGQSYCNRCPNIPLQSSRSLRGRHGLMGFKSIEECELLSSYIAGNRARKATSEPINSRPKTLQAIPIA